MLTIGLTGGIGSGKSTVASLLAEKGAIIIIADYIGWELLLKASPVYSELVEAFGGDILDEYGRIERKKLGKLVFSKPEKLQKLNDIVHPHLKKRLWARISDIRTRRPDAIIIVDAALIIESGIIDKFEGLVVVTAPQEQRVQRLMAERLMTREEALSRIQSQMADEERLKYATWVINNDGSMEALQDKIDRLWSDIEERAAAATQ
jgi:dephospho-CoA kinase